MRVMFTETRCNNTGYEATFRVAAYSSVVYLVSWIPVLGWIVGAIYGIYLGVVGIRAVHGTTTGRLWSSLYPSSLSVVLPCSSSGSHCSRYSPPPASSNRKPARRHESRGVCGREVS